MEVWVAIAIGAAFLQNVRSSLQKYLKGRLSNGGATFSWFIFGLPVAVAILAGMIWIGGYTLPEPNLRFGLFAILGVVVLSDTITPLAGLALLVSLVGVVLISATNGLRGGILNRGALIGIGSGALFAVAGVSYRGASLALGSGDFLIRATFTLACVLLFQTLTMGAWLRLREVGQIRAVLKSWRVSAMVGLAGGLASLGWFSAMTLQNAAYVKAVGQVELLFTFAVSVLVFRERSSGREVAGILLVSAGIILLLLWR